MQRIFSFIHFGESLEPHPATRPVGDDTRLSLEAKESGLLAVCPVRI